MEHAGRVIDGPLRGQMKTEDRRFFECYAPPRMPSYAYFGRPEYLEDTVHIDRVLYQWSYSLGEWCMVY
jgi:hypothetical protein